jgi:hypothetical protein
MGGLVSGITQDIFNRKAASEGRAAYARAADDVRAGKAGALEKYQPYVDLGQQALSPLSGLVLGKQYDPETGEYKDINQQQRLNLFQESPDYQFRLQQGQQALERSQAARGGLLSGRAALEAQRLGQGEASSEYNNYVNRLQSLAGMGQQAAVGSANVITGAASQLAGFDLGVGQLQAQLYQNRGKLYGEGLGQITNAGLSAAAPTTKTNTTPGAPGSGAGQSSFLQRFGQNLSGGY